jgi:hypothetical protein
MHFQEIWLSSIQHQIAFNQIYRNNSWIRRALGLYDLPIGFPYIKFLYQKFPIVYTSRYSLNILENGFNLVPNTTFGYFNKAENINVGIEKAFQIDKIIELTRYENPNPIVKAININWIHLKYYNAENEETEMLLCVGGNYMPTMKTETNQLFEMLNQFPKS